jgi:glycosyltransferase involved in cell wall biosynthesis
MTTLQKSKPELSIVIPLLDEHESIPALYQGIVREMSAMNCGYEIIFIDDGSTDGSFDVISKLRENDECVKGIRLRRNFGKSLALNEAFRRASGDILITMDADLQDDPKEIPRLIDKLNEGYDLVSGWKKIRKDPVISKNFPSKLFNMMVSWGSGLKLHDFNCGLKAYRRSVVGKLHLYGEMHRFVPVLAHAQGYRVTEIPVKHHSRKFGESKFGLTRFTHGFFDFMTVVFLTKFLKRPMHFFGGLGSLVSAIGVIICTYLTYLWLVGEVIGNRPLLTLGVLLIIVGVQMVTTGLVAEMLNYNNRKYDNGEIVQEYLGL